MHCQRPHSESLAGEYSWENLPWAGGPAVSPAPAQELGVGSACAPSGRALDG